MYEGFHSSSAKVETMDTRGTEVRHYNNAAVMTHGATTTMRDGQHETTDDIRATATYINKRRAVDWSRNTNYRSNDKYREAKHRRGA